MSEFVGRYNVRDLDTVDQMSQLAMGIRETRLKYENLIAGNGLKSGARGR